MNMNNGKERVTIRFEGDEFTINVLDSTRSYYPNGYLKKESEHARVYHHSYEDDFSEIIHDIYALCEKGFETEGERLLMGYLVENKQEEIESQKADLAISERTLERYMKKAESIANEMADVEYGVYCKVRMSIDECNVVKWTVDEKQESRKNHKRDINIEEGTGSVLGYCWKEDVEACKQIILEKEIKLKEKCKKEMTEHFNKESKELDDKIEALTKRLKKG